jgi:hypothetical protein
VPGLENIVKNQKGGRREIVDLERMRVRDLIVYYLRNEKKEHTAHRDAIIEFIRSSQSEHVKKGYRTPSGLTSLMRKRKKPEKER